MTDAEVRSLLRMYCADCHEFMAMPLGGLIQADALLRFVLLHFSVRHGKDNDFKFVVVPASEPDYSE